MIVGKNNSGKSTILEALRIYCGKAHPSLLREILSGHNEYFQYGQSQRTENSESDWRGLSNFFPKRLFPDNDDTSISIESNKKKLISIEYVFYYIQESIEKEESTGETILRSRSRITVNKAEVTDLIDNVELTTAIRITLGEHDRSAWLNLFSNIRSPNSSINWRVLDDVNTPKCSYVSTSFSSSEKLAELWDQIALLPEGRIVLEALNIIDPDVEGLTFIKDIARFSSRDIKRLPIVKLKSIDFPIPLNSMGDGMSRILQLILSIFPAKNGILLIDEFENGLHFSIQEEVWKVIFKLAKDLDIQVFATTHSWDCIESFTKAALESPDDGILLKISRSKLTSDNGKVIATVYDEEALKTVTASALEVR